MRRIFRGNFFSVDSVFNMTGMTGYYLSTFSTVEAPYLVVPGALKDEIRRFPRLLSPACHFGDRIFSLEGAIFHSGVDMDFIDEKKRETLDLKRLS